MSGTTLVPSGSLAISPTGISPSSFSFSKTVRLSLKIPSDGPQPQRTSPLVWPLSLSLAATEEIDLSFSSYGYLDVSVPRVSFLQPMGSAGDT